MTMSRRLIIRKGENVYHCISRCVRRAYLCGEDLPTGRNFNHRKGWVRDRLIFLSGIFAIDVLGYALMSTHSHSMLRTRPDLLRGIDDNNIVRRWFKLYPKKAIPAGSQAFEELVKLTTVDCQRVKVLRKRLGSISWFMKSLNEFIARKANKEDKCKGRFWEGRFKCQRLCDQAAVLSCAAYIDLNPIRAKIATTPETSQYTSAYDRIKSLKLNKARLKSLSAENNYYFEPPLWLSPVQDCCGRKGFLPMTLPEYLKILDISGKEIIEGKRGSIPIGLAPILERIGIKSEHWVETCQSCCRRFSSFIGSRDSLISLAADTGKLWFKGMSSAGRYFTHPASAINA